MLVYKLVKQLTDKFDSIIDSKISDGADGEVFLTKDNKVIKFVVFYPWIQENLEDVVSSRLNIYRAIKDNSHLYAKIYEYGYIGKSCRETVNGNQEYALFYYVTERCDSITDDESKVFHTILSHEDANKCKQYTITEVKSMLHGMSYGLDFSNSKVLELYSSMQNCKVKHLDLHPRNVMKSNGKFKLIDFDRCSIV